MDVILMLLLSTASYFQISDAAEFPKVIQGEFFKIPLSLISPNDMRGPHGEISSFYTQVAPKDKWPNGTVFWEYDPANTFTPLEKEIIERGLKEIENETCISFKPKTDQVGYVNIKNDASGCWATAGYQGAKQNVNMANNCFGDTSTIIHEIMHALGFQHEQTRYDRDLFLDVQWDNIEKNQTHNFDKYPRTVAYPKYLYDFTSVMQYTLDSFGMNGRPAMILTIENSTLEVNTIGKATKMSKSDILRMRSAYRCDFHGEGAARPDQPKRKKNNNKKGNKNGIKKWNKRLTKKWNKNKQSKLSNRVLNERARNVADMTFF